MKILFSLLILFATHSVLGQQQNPPTDVRLFAQCLFSISTQSELDALTYDLYSTNPNIEMVRLDLNTQRAFFVTANLEELSVQDFTSWFGEHSSTVSCVQIGIYGVDTMNPYPFTNCQ
jgi:hypothetical protein